MVRFRYFILIVLACISFSPIFNRDSYAADVCIIDSYKIKITQKIKDQLSMVLSQNGNVSYANYGDTRQCRVKIILGTPGVVKELKKASPYEKVIYTFVMFPEVLGLDKKKNFYGVRIFPLPMRTINKFFSYTGMKKRKVAVIVSKMNEKIAKKYLPSHSFDILLINSRVEEAFPKLNKYKYIYIFPDPEVLKLVNVLSLVNYAKHTGKILIAGLPDLDRYDINFIYAVDFPALTRELVKLTRENPKKHILPCPAKVKVWVSR
jgi:hypothetical protein